MFLRIFNIELDTALIETGVLQLLVYFSFLSLTQMFVVIFGSAGMFFNILFLSLQLVTSGVIVPKAMLSSFYQTIGSYLPATYASERYYTVVYGGESSITNIFNLLLISAVTLVVILVEVIPSL
ncbi:hypothetical protein ACSVDA_14240 [Cytobacillus sp. Hm23]